MGSRAVLVVCRDDDGRAAALRRRGRRRGHRATRAPAGPSSPTRARARAARARARGRSTAPASGTKFETDWLCLDAELMPWSAKARSCCASSTQPSALPPARGAARPRWRRSSRRPRAASTSADAARALPRARGAADALSSRPTGATAGRSARIDDLRLAPFHLLASEGRRPHRQDHVWHMAALAELCAGRPETAGGDAASRR